MYLSWGAVGCLRYSCGHTKENIKTVHGVFPERTSGYEVEYLANSMFRAAYVWALELKPPDSKTAEVIANIHHPKFIYS